MATAADPKFACPACGKEYRWKPELAGRSAKCACGGKLVVPATPPNGSPAAAAAAPVKPPAAKPSAPAPPVPAPAQAKPQPAATSAPTNACPSCSSPLSAGAVLCVNCGYNLKTGQKLSLVVETDDEDEEQEKAPAKK